MKVMMKQVALLGFEIDIASFAMPMIGLGWSPGPAYRGCHRHRHQCRHHVHALSVIGATPNAKKVAAAHILFNLGTGIAALTILPMLFRIVAVEAELLQLHNAPTMTLALFHTTFNVLEVLLIMSRQKLISMYCSRMMCIEYQHFWI